MKHSAFTSKSISTIILHSQKLYLERLRAIFETSNWRSPTQGVAGVGGEWRKIKKTLIGKLRDGLRVFMRYIYSSIIQDLLLKSFGKILLLALPRLFISLSFPIQCTMRRLSSSMTRYTKFSRIWYRGIYYCSVSIEFGTQGHILSQTLWIPSNIYDSVYGAV